MMRDSKELLNLLIQGVQDESEGSKAVKHYLNQLIQEPILSRLTKKLTICWIHFVLIELMIESPIKSPYVTFAIIAIGM